MTTSVGEGAYTMYPGVIVTIHKWHFLDRVQPKKTRYSLNMNGNSKLSEALKYGPEMLEYIISLNPHDFERLRNPLMQKVMPVRISLRRIAKMVNIPEQDFVDKINDLAGIPREHVGDEPEPPVSHQQIPDWMHKINEEEIVWVDLLADDELLKDPMPPINIAISKLPPGGTLAIKHKWEPQPLFDIWEMRGFQYWTRQMGHNEWHIFVHKLNQEK